VSHCSQTEPTPPNVQTLTSHGQKAFDALTVFKAKRLPSQEQVQIFLQLVLCSNVLNVNGQGFTGVVFVSDEDSGSSFDEMVLRIGLGKNGECE
jgi:hypothetical protein